VDAEALSSGRVSVIRALPAS